MASSASTRSGKRALALLQVGQRGAAEKELLLLESKAKEFGAAIVVSEPAIVQAGQEIADLRSEEIAIRGRNSQMKVFLLSKEESERYL